MPPAVGEKRGGCMHHADAVWRRVSQVSQTPMPYADASQDTAGQGPCVWCLRRCSSQRCRARRRRMMSWRCLPGWARWRTSCSSRRPARSTTRWAFSYAKQRQNNMSETETGTWWRTLCSSRSPVRSTTSFFSCKTTLEHHQSNWNSNGQGAAQGGVLFKASSAQRHRLGALQLNTNDRVRYRDGEQRLKKQKCQYKQKGRSAGRACSQILWR